MRGGWRIATAMMMFGLAGCQQNSPFLQPGPPPGQAGAAGVSNPLAAVNTQWQAANQTLTSQMKDLNTRIAQIDATNRDLTQQVAQSEQARQQMTNQMALLQKQLGETGAKLKDVQTAKAEAEQRAEALLASTRARGGAILSANSSVKQNLQAINLPGLEVRPEGDVIRISLPADRLFATGGVTLSPDGSKLIDDVATAVLQAYPRQRIVVEGHTDDSLAANPAAAHGMAGAQAQAVFQQLIVRNRFPANQLSILAMGANHPRVSNATPGGKAQNRRVEVVIYPDTYAG